MFQTFSGSSRRPRQVNLSGQEPNPFSAWGAASGTHITVQAAHAEREHRKQERERLNAAKRIQRTWRGHRSRKELANARRQAWDDMERNTSGHGSQISSKIVEELRLLFTFFNSQNPTDIGRLSRLGERLLRASQEGCLSEKDLQPQLLRLARIILSSLTRQSPCFYENLLCLLRIIIESDATIITKIAYSYYGSLSSLMLHTNLARERKRLFLSVITAPLAEHRELGSGYEIAIGAYGPFALLFLTMANLCEALDGLEDLAASVNIEHLSEALIWASKTNALLSVQPQPRLWLLAHLIRLNRLRNGTNQEPVYMRALSVLISSSANEIVGRIDQDDSESLNQSGDDEDNAHLFTQPLPPFIKEELVTLVNKQSVTGLLEKFNTDYITASSTAQAEDDASLLASYALMLLRIFSRLDEDIRVWLYQGSITDKGSGNRIPAVKLFWRVMSTTSMFSAIRKDSKSALNILRNQPRPQSPMPTSQEEVTRERDWHSILLFLELYDFVLRFTDDEEFFSGGSDSITEPGRHTSRSRESALPLQDVKLLTIFLKNLSFTMYFNSAEILDDSQIPNEGGLGTYFGTSSSKKNFEHVALSQQTEDTEKRYSEQRGFLGIPGMTFNYVRNIVTRVMRMLYERDSRRRFLPKDHWLMTSRFDMEGFIPAVVMEEERRHEATEDEEDIDDDSSDVIPLVSGRHNMIGMQRSRQIQQSENLQKKQKRAARKKMLASIAPRLEILQNMPYAIPFSTRVQIFRQFVYQDQFRRRGGHVDPDHWRMSVIHGEHSPFSRITRGDILSRRHARIRRDHVFEDAYEYFYDLGEALKEPIQITFVDKFDTVEAGIDGGGVTKEFLTSVTNEAFHSPNRAFHSANEVFHSPNEAFHSSNEPGMFVANDQNLLYPNPSAIDEKMELLRRRGVRESSPEWGENLVKFLKHYEFLGRIVGKCLYEGILVDIAFAGFFLLKWASTSGGSSSSQDSRYLANINDLRDLDESLYQGLLQLKNYPGDVTDFSLDFTINDTISMPGEPTRTITRNLLPDGSKFPVTNENRILYVSGVAHHRLHSQPYQQTQAFLRGLWKIINPSWLSMFNQAELQTLIGGDSSEIDVDDLRRNTIYSGVYEIGDDGLEHPTVQIFWEVMRNLDDSDRRKVLKYVTSTPRGPLLGFSQLNPRFSIRDAGSDEQRLPSTSTCINLLKLPRYQSAATLKEKLLYAINSGAGFDLS